MPSGAELMHAREFATSRGSVPCMRVLFFMTTRDAKWRRNEITLREDPAIRWLRVEARVQYV